MIPTEKQDAGFIRQRISELSPAKRKLLDKLLDAKASLAAGPKPRPRGPDSDAVPLSFAQQRVWFMDQWAPGTPVFNLNAAIRLSFPLQSAVLERCLNEIVRRHEMLRTTFVTVGERPIQRIASQLKLALPVFDLQRLPPEDREVEAPPARGQGAAKTI